MSATPVEKKSPFDHAKLARSDPVLRLLSSQGWCVVTGRKLGEQELGTQLARCEGAHTAPVSHCLLTDDGNALVSASEDSTLVLWDAMKGIPLRYLTGHTALITSILLLDCNPSGGADEHATRASRVTGKLRFVVSASQDGSVRVWDVRSGIDQCFLRLGSALTCLAKSRDEKTLAAGDVAGRLHLLSLQHPPAPARKNVRGASASMLARGQGASRDASDYEDDDSSELDQEDQDDALV